MQVRVTIKCHGQGQRCFLCQTHGFFSEKTLALVLIECVCRLIMDQARRGKLLALLVPLLPLVLNNRVLGISHESHDQAGVNADPGARHHVPRASLLRRLPPLAEIARRGLQQHFRGPLQRAPASQFGAPAPLSVARTVLQT